MEGEQPNPYFLNLNLPELKTSHEKRQADVIKDSTPNWKWEKGTFINCDLRYFPLASFKEKFEIVVVDPPWRLKGSKHDYGTLHDEDIIGVDAGALSNYGFCFLWTPNSKLPIAFECLLRWGYSYADRIIWVKKNEKGTMILEKGEYFLNATEICLVGTK